MRELDFFLASAKVTTHVGVSDRWFWGLKTLIYLLIRSDGSRTIGCVSLSRDLFMIAQFDVYESR